MKIKLLLSLLLTGLTSLSFSQDSGTEIEAWVTSPDRSMLFQKSSEKILFSDKGQGRGNPIVIDESHIMQSIDTPEGRIVLIVANDSGNTSSFQIRFRSHSATIRLTSGSVGTYVWQV